MKTTTKHYFVFKTRLDEDWEAEFGYRTPAMESHEAVAKYLETDVGAITQSILDDRNSCIRDGADVTRQQISIGIQKWLETGMLNEPDWFHPDFCPELESIQVAVKEEQDEFYGIVFVDTDKYTFSEPYRTDAYTSYGRAKEAFCNLETMELFQCLVEMQNNEDPPVSFETHYETAEDIKAAYEENVDDVTETVMRMRDWVSGSRPYFKDENEIIEFTQYRVVVHRET